MNALLVYALSLTAPVAALAQQSKAPAQVPHARSVQQVKPEQLTRMSVGTTLQPATVVQVGIVELPSYGFLKKYSVRALSVFPSKADVPEDFATATLGKVKLPDGSLALNVILFAIPKRKFGFSAPQPQQVLVPVITVTQEPQGGIPKVLVNGLLAAPLK